MKPFQIVGKDKIFAWLEHQTDATKRELMVVWLADFAQDPLSAAHRVPGIDAPVYLAETAVRPWIVKFLYAEQFHCVRIIEFDTLP